MSLDNLVGRTLEKITPDRANIKLLLSAAKRNIDGAKEKRSGPLKTPEMGVT